MTVSRDEEILGLQVAMDDALAVRRGETPRNLERVVDSLLLRDRTGVELSAQRLSLEKLHHRVRDPCLRAEVEDGQDVRMGKRRDRFRLALEASQRVGIGGDGLREDLDRDVPVQLVIPRAVDLPHATSADRREDLVSAERRPGWEGQCGVRLHEPCRQGLVAFGSEPVTMAKRGTPMKYGARNNLVAKVKSVKRGDVMSLVKFEVQVPHDMASVLTTESVDDLSLQVGDTVHLVIKAIHVLTVRE